MAASSTVTFVAQYTGGAVKTLEHYPVFIRISNSLVSYTDYLVKAFWPFSLSPFYPYQKVWVLVQVAAAALFLVVASVIALRYARSRPWLFVGWFWYLGVLVPVIGLVQVGSQARADRYTYVPLIGIFIVLAWQLPELLARWRRAPAALAAAGAVVLALCGATTWRQVGHWRDNFSLFERAIELDPDNWLAHAFIGATYRRRGDLDLAIHHYRRALARGVFGGKVRYQLAASLRERGDLDEALQMYDSVVRFDPVHAGAYNGAGEIVLARGDAASAVSLFASAVHNDPTSETYYQNLKTALLEQKRRFANQSFVPEAVSLLRPDDQMEYYMGAQPFSAPEAPAR
jgi:tetratricopeptide (TPR) repeat protein